MAQQATLPARSDGVFTVRWEGEISPEIVSYTLAHREDEEPFDVAFGGRTPGGDGSRGAEIVDSYAQAGVTWWVEDVAMWRFAAWEPWNAPYTWPVEAIEARIRQGPPFA